MGRSTEHDVKSLSEFIAVGNSDNVRSFMSSLPSGDSARLLTRLESDETRQLLTLLHADEAAQLLSELSANQAADLIVNLAPELAATLIERFPSNVQVDLLGQLGSAAAPIIAFLSDQAVERTSLLAKYSSDTAGGLMVTEILAYPDQVRVSDVIEDLRAHAREYSRFDVQYAYITDPNKRLVGVLRLRDLLLLASDESVEKATVRAPLHVLAEATLDELHRLFDRHRFFGLPVVDADGRLLGAVLRADVAEATSDRADRRLLLMSGVLGGEEFRSMAWSSRVLRRAPWLCASLVLSLVAASVIGWYQETLAAALALAMYLPVISGMGGNSGNQALAVSIRELSLGLVQPQEFLWVILKEASVGLTNGILIGMTVATLCFAWQGSLRLSFVVGTAILLNTLIAACLGGIVPLLLKHLRLDPALASGPILAAVNDLCGFLFALMLADWLLLKGAF